MREAIRVVSEAVKKRLDDVLGTDAVFIGPLDDDGAKDHRMVLFLYRVAVNPDLRNTRHLVPPPVPADPPVDTDRALPLDLYYLLTAGDPQTGGEPTALETLGTAIQTLNDTPTFTGTNLNDEVVRVTLDPLSSEEMGRIWNLFPTANYRTSVVYLASPVWIYPAILPPPGAAVVEEAHRIGQRPVERV